MNRTIYKGPFWPTLEEALKAELDSVNRRPLDEVRIIVPSRLLKRHLRRALAEGKRGHAGLIFLSFNDLAAQGSFHELMKRGLKPLPDISGKLLARAALKSLQKGDGFYPLRDMPGFAAALLETISDLKEARITPDYLSTLAERLPDPRKAREIARLFAEYEQIKNERKLCDDNDRIALAIAHFRDNPPAHETPVFIHGVYDVTNLQKELLKAYLGDADAVVTAPWWEETDEFVRPYLDFLARLDFKEASREMYDRALSRRDADNGDEVKPTLFSAPGQSREAREVVREVLLCCIENNIPLDEAAILIRQPEEYLPLFREEMEAVGAPFYMPDGDRLDSTHAGRALSYLIKMLDRKYARTQVGRFLEGSPLKRRAEDESPPEVERWAQLAREAWVIEGRDEWEKNLADLKEKRKAAIKNAEEPDASDVIRQKSDIAEIDRCLVFLKELFDALDALPAKAPWPRFAESIAALCERFVDSGAEGFDEVMGLIRSISGLHETGEEASRDEVITVLTDALDEMRFRPATSQEHGIVVAGIMVARCVPFRVVAVPGVVERSFPRVVRQDPLLLDNERREINRRRAEEGIPEMDIKSRGRLEEDMLFRLTCRSAREHLAISYPRLDPQSGQEKMPSAFFIRAAGKAGEKQATVERRGSLSAPFPGELGKALTEMEYILSSAYKRIFKERNDALSFLGDISPFFKRAFRAEEERWRKENFTPFDAVFSSKEALAALREGKHTLDDRPLSPRRLEKYAHCPYRYFVEEILGASTPEEPERIRRIEPMDRGSLIHRILFRFFSDRRDARKLPLERSDLDKHIRVMERIAGKEFAAFKKQGGVGWPIIWEISQHEILEDLKALLEHEVEIGDWIPHYFEARFGYRSRGGDEDREISSDKPVEVELVRDIRVTLRGKIDRIDIGRDGATIRIVDYKTGSSGGFINNSFNAGEQLQAPLYSLAAAEMLPGREIGPAEYRFIKKGQLKTVSFSSARDPENLAKLAFIVRTITEGVSKGLFFMYREDSCRYCDLAHHCGGAADALYEQKRGDQRLNRWHEMKEMK